MVAGLSLHEQLHLYWFHFCAYLFTKPSFLCCWESFSWACLQQICLYNLLTYSKIWLIILVVNMLLLQNFLWHLTCKGTSVSVWSSLPSDDALSAHSKHAKHAVPPTSNFVSWSPVVVRFVVLSSIFFDVSFELFLLIFCSELSDAGDDDNEEEGSKTMGKRQYIYASSLFFFVFWVWLLGDTQSHLGPLGLFCNYVMLGSISIHDFSVITLYLEAFPPVTFL